MNNANNPTGPEGVCCYYGPFSRANLRKRGWRKLWAEYT